MKNCIEEELEASKEKMFKTIDNNGKLLAELSRDNVAIAEAMISNASEYIRMTDVNAKPVYNTKNVLKYGGSSAYWMTRLKNVLIDGIFCDEKTYEEIIKGAVEAVDRENSTHLNSDNVGRVVVIKRICGFGREELVECLKNPDYKDMKLIAEISEKISDKKGARSNLSFASKFCHYACFYLFEGTEYQDNYPIYDNILRKVLPLYLDYYKLYNYNLGDYREYRETVDSIREAVRNTSGTEISRNGLDHLLWYYHKGRL